MDMIKTQLNHTVTPAELAKSVEYYPMHDEPADKLRAHVGKMVNYGLDLCKLLINDPFTDVTKSLANEKEMRNEIKSQAKAHVNSIKFYTSLGIADPDAFHSELVKHSLDVATKLWTNFSLQKKVLSKQKFENFVEKHLSEYHNNERFDSRIKDQPVGKAQLLPPIRPPVVNRTEDKKVAANSPVQQKSALRKIVEQSAVQSSMPALKPIKNEMPALKPIKSEMPELRVASDMPKLVELEDQDDDVELVDEEIGGPKDWYYAAKSDRAKRKQEKYKGKEEKAEAKKKERKEKKMMKEEWPGVDLVQYPKSSTPQTAPPPQVQAPAPTSNTFVADKAVSWLREAVQNKKIALKEGASYVLFAPSNETLTQLENYYASGKVVGQSLAPSKVIEHHLALGVHKDSQFTTMTGLKVEKAQMNITAPVKTSVLISGNNTMKRIAIGTSFVTIMPHGTIFPK